MPSIAILYFSGSGHTHLQAEAIAQGARGLAGVQVDLLRIDGSQIKDGRWQHDAFAAKLKVTYMGGPAAQFKAFADWSGGVWFQQGWQNKLAGGFTHSGSPSGDKLSTIQYFWTLAMQHSMHWISVGVPSSRYTGDGKDLNHVGGYGGLMGAGGAPQGQPAKISDGDRETAVRFGKRFAEAVARWRSPV
jgi:NAD(P)H dehydrogenase (quinone)